MRGTWSLFFRGNAADMERLSAGVDGLADDVRYQAVWPSWKNAEFRYSDGIVTRIASQPCTGAIGGVREVMEVFHQYAPQTEAAKFKYDRQCEKGLDYLREAAKIEGYMNDSVAAQFDILAGMLKHDLNRDLDFNKDEIIKILDTEITSRYYSDSDMIRRSIRDDKALDEAVAVLLDPEKYNKILSPIKK